MPPTKHSLTEYITVLNEKANKSNCYALCHFCKTKLTNTKKLEQYTEHEQKRILFCEDENNQYNGPELDSSSSICTNEPSDLSILSNSSSTLSVEKSDKAHWEKLVLNSTIDNGWSFRWVDKKSNQILFSYANPGLKLPSCKILAGCILTSNSDKIRIALMGGKNIKKQEILGSVLITSDELNIKYNAMITDSASQNQAARKQLALE
ncbi:10632_t:CDS:2 [Entrophospora sp. SA101]|nr:10632_t:CDS:2 [Entrophospora sp. SA101]